MDRAGVWCLLIGLAFAMTAVADDSTPPVPGKESTKELIKLLGHKQFSERERAAKILSDRPEALPELREAIKGTVPEIRRRAAQIIPVLEKAVRRTEIERLCTGIGKSGLDRLAHLIVDDSEKATEKQWTALIDAAHAIVLRASELNQRDYENITKPFLAAMRRDKPSEPTVEWRRTIRGTKSPIQQFGGGILLSNGDIESIGSLGWSLIIVDGDLKRCTGACKSLIICTGSVVNAGTIMDSIVVAGGRVHLHAASRSCVFAASISRDFELPRNGGLLLDTNCALKIGVFFDPKITGLDAQEVDSGLVLRGVPLGSSADRAGLTKGDRILTVDYVVVRTNRECRNALIGKRSGKKVPIEFERQGQRRRADLVMP